MMLPSTVGGHKILGMKAMMISVALVLAMGCGKEETPKPQGEAKGPSKPALSDSKKSQPNPTPKKETPQPNTGSKSIVNNSGTVLWGFVTGGEVRSSPVIGADGTIYVGSFDKKVYALDGKIGAKKWGFVTGRPVPSSPAIGAEGTVYVGSADKKVYALDGKSGAKKWEFVTGADGTIYVGSFDKKVYALNGKTGAKEWEFMLKGSVRSSPVVDSGGTVYVGSGSFDKKIYALKTDSKGLAKTPNIPAVHLISN